MFDAPSQDELLIINNLKFKAYLEDSDITYEMKDQQLPFTPTSFNNDSMMLRVMQKAKFSFNVFSENREECKRNYDNLHSLLQIIRPSYSYANDQLAPFFSNVTGYVSLTFKGMPERDTIPLHLTSFSYSINKELGFVEIPRSEYIMLGEGSSFSKLKEPGFKSKLLPIAYKITLDGKILLNFEDTVKLANKKTEDRGRIDIQALKDAAGTDKTYQAQLEALLYKITNKRLAQFQNPQEALNLVKTLKDTYSVDSNGNFIQNKDLTNFGGVPDGVLQSSEPNRRFVHDNLRGRLINLK